MLVTLLFLPIFFIFGLLFGLFSWLLAGWVICGSSKFEWTRKWQAFSRASIKMSKDHNILVAHGADFVETFECIKPCRVISKNILIQYYKLGHSLSVYLVLFLLTLFKTLLLFPIWSALCCGEAYTAQLDRLLAKGGNGDGEGKDAATATTALRVDRTPMDERDENYVEQERGDDGDMLKTQIAKANASGAYDTSWIEDDNATFGNQ